MPRSTQTKQRKLLEKPRAKAQSSTKVAPLQQIQEKDAILRSSRDPKLITSHSKPKFKNKITDYSTKKQNEKNQTEQEEKTFTVGTKIKIQKTSLRRELDLPVKNYFSK